MGEESNEVMSRDDSSKLYSLLGEVQDNIKEAEENLEAAQKKVKEFKRIINTACVLQDEIKLTSKSSGKFLAQIKKKLADLRETSQDKEELEKLDMAVLNLSENLATLREVRSETGSLFARLFMGRVNLKMFSGTDRLRLRDEYNKFKLRTAVIYLLFPLIVLFFHYYMRYLWTDTHWINIFYQLWLLYYYISLALRENVLLVNGSNILPWWLYHHYLAALATVVLLVWPATAKYESFVPWFTTFAAYNGLVMNLQNLYHKKREYANRALGNIRHMDITYQETITEFPKELLLLLPFLIVAQVWEILLSFLLFKTFFFECELDKIYWTEYREELQILACAVLNLTMGLGNMFTTLQTLKSKVNLSQKFRSLKERSAARLGSLRHLNGMMVKQVSTITEKDTEEREQDDHEKNE